MGNEIAIADRGDGDEGEPEGVFGGLDSAAGGFFDHEHGSGAKDQNDEETDRNGDEGELLAVFEETFEDVRPAVEGAENPDDPDQPGETPPAKGVDDWDGREEIDPTPCEEVAGPVFVEVKEEEKVGKKDGADEKIGHLQKGYDFFRKRMKQGDGEDKNHRDRDKEHDELPGQRNRATELVVGFNEHARLLRRSFG